MRLTSIFAGLALVFMASAAQAGFSEVQNERRTFVFSGQDCQVDCSDELGGASAVLTLEFGGFNGFAVGGPVFFGSNDILGFQFSGSDVFSGFEFINDGEFFATGVLFGDQNEFANVLIQGQAFIDAELNNGEELTPRTAAIGEQQIISFEFRTTALETAGVGITPGDGGWSMCIVEGPGCEIITPGLDDIGLTGTWSPAPEPGAFALLGVGLLGLAAMRRRRSLSA